MKRFLRRAEDAEPARSWSPRRIVRLLGLAVLLATLGTAAVIGWTEMPGNEQHDLVWRARLGLLQGLEAMYGAALLAAPVATPVLCVLLLRARRNRTSRPMVARGLLLCGTFLLGVPLIESAVFLRFGSAAGPSTSSPAPDPVLIPEPPDRIELPATYADAPGRPVTLVVLGESSAEGVPYNRWISLGGLVAWQLERAIPSRRFRCINVAISGDNLEGQHRKLAALEERPDVLIIYCGHNEFSSRIAWSRKGEPYRDGPPAAIWETFIAWLERTMPVCGQFGKEIRKCRIAIPPPRDVHRDLIDVPAYTQAEKAALLADFEARLDRLVRHAEQIGAIPILITPPSNESGFEPNRSYLPSEMPYAERMAFAREFEAARRSDASDPSQSIARYRALLARQPGFAEAHFRLARLLEKTGAWDEVYEHDVKARDLDGMPMRLPSDFHDAYRAVAARHRCIFIDGPRYFHAIGRHGLLDEHLFHDAMHPSFRGQVALTQAVLQGLRAWRAFGWPENTPAPRLDLAECARQFGIGRAEWMYICTWGIMFYMKISPLHYDQSARQGKQQAFATAYNRIRDGTPPEGVGLPNIGIHEAIPFVSDAAVVTEPGSNRVRAARIERTQAGQ